jgi:hypothetical protein
MANQDHANKYPASSSLFSPFLSSNWATRLQKFLADIRQYWSSELPIPVKSGRNRRSLSAPHTPLSFVHLLTPFSGSKIQRNEYVAETQSRRRLQPPLGITTGGIRRHRSNARAPLYCTPYDTPLPPPIIGTSPMFVSSAALAGKIIGTLGRRWALSPSRFVRPI